MSTRSRSISRRYAAGFTRSLPTILLGALGSAVLLGACSSSEVRITLPEDQPANISLFIEVPDDQVRNAVTPAFSVRIEDGSDTLQINEAVLVVNQIEFGRDTGECVDSTNPDDGDACSEAQQDPTNPVLITAPVDLQSAILTSQPIDVEPGDYDRLELDLHPATSENTEIVTQGIAPGSSVRVRGSFNGQPLADESGGTIQFGPEASLELELGEPGESFTLNEGESGAITLVVDVDSWFRDEEGSLIDPRDAVADPDLKSVVEQNISESLQATPGPPDNNEF